MSGQDSSWSDNSKQNRESREVMQPSRVAMKSCPFQRLGMPGVGLSVGSSNRAGSLLMKSLNCSTSAFLQSQQSFRAVAFADRAYEPDGSLRSRKFPDALVADPKEAAERALRIAQTGIVSSVDGSEIIVKAKTLCVHSDTPGSHLIARSVREGLERAGINVKPLMLLD